MPKEEFDIIQNKSEHSADEELKSELNGNDSLPASYAMPEDQVLDPIDVTKIG